MLIFINIVNKNKLRHVGCLLLSDKKKWLSKSYNSTRPDIITPMK